MSYYNREDDYYPYDGRRPEYRETYRNNYPESYSEPYSRPSRQHVSVSVPTRYPEPARARYPPQAAPKRFYIKPSSQGPRQQTHVPKPKPKRHNQSVKRKRSDDSKPRRVRNATRKRTRLEQQHSQSALLMEKGRKKVKQSEASPEDLAYEKQFEADLAAFEELARTYDTSRKGKEGKDSSDAKQEESEEDAKSTGDATGNTKDAKISDDTQDDGKDDTKSLEDGQKDSKSSDDSKEGAKSSEAPADAPEATVEDTLCKLAPILNFIQTDRKYINTKQRDRVFGSLRRLAVNFKPTFMEPLLWRMMAELFEETYKSDVFTGRQRSHFYAIKEFFASFSVDPESDMSALDYTEADVLPNKLDPEHFQHIQGQFTFATVLKMPAVQMKTLRYILEAKNPKLLDALIWRCKLQLNADVALDILATCSQPLPSKPVVKPEDDSVTMDEAEDVAQDEIKEVQEENGTTEEPVWLAPRLAELYTLAAAPILSGINSAKLSALERFDAKCMDALCNLLSAKACQNKEIHQKLVNGILKWCRRQGYESNFFTRLVELSPPELPESGAEDSATKLEKYSFMDCHSQRLEWNVSAAELKKLTDSKKAASIFSPIAFTGLLGWKMKLLLSAPDEEGARSVGVFLCRGLKAAAVTKGVLSGDTSVGKDWMCYTLFSLELVSSVEGKSISKKAGIAMDSLLGVGSDSFSSLADVINTDNGYLHDGGLCLKATVRLNSLASMFLSMVPRNLSMMQSVISDIDFPTLERTLKSKTLDVPGEAVVLDTVMAWCTAHPGPAGPNALVPCIRLEHVPMQRLCELLTKPCILDQKEGFKASVAKALQNVCEGNVKSAPRAGYKVTKQSSSAAIRIVMSSLLSQTLDLTLRLQALEDRA